MTIKTINHIKTMLKTIFGIIHHANIKQFEYFVKLLVRTKQKFKKHMRVVKMDKKQLKIAVKSRFIETNEFIDNTLKEECEKEKITADEVIFFLF